MNQQQQMEKPGFDRQAFNVMFDEELAKLHNSERITKAILGNLSRLLLEQMHFDGDIQPVNRLLQVLTPMNRKTAVLFFQHFTGHHYSEKDETFGKRDKGNYAKKQAAAVEFLADEANNIWTWAQTNVQMEAKPFELKKVTQFVERALKKAEEAGFTQADVIKAMLAGGLEIDALAGVLESMVPENQEKQAA